MINLLPTHIKEERMYGRRNRTMLTYSISLIFTAGVIAGVMLASMQFVSSDEATLESEISSSQVEIAALESNIQNVENVATRLQTAKKLSESSIKFSNLIPQIGSILPEGVVLNALSLTGGKTDPLVLDVDLKSADLAPIFARNITQSPLFEAADIASITPKGVATDSNAPAYGFSASVSASFKGTAEAKRKQAAQEAAKAAQEAQKQQEGAKSK